jgi:hypothetical protein
MPRRFSSSRDKGGIHAALLPLNNFDINPLLAFNITPQICKPIWHRLHWHKPRPSLLFYSVQVFYTQPDVAHERIANINSEVGLNESERLLKLLFGEPDK